MSRTRIAPARYRVREQTARMPAGAPRAADAGIYPRPPYITRRRWRGMRFAVMAAVAALAIALITPLLAPVVRMLGGEGAGVAAAPETSTPIGEWRQGEVPALYQTDPAWAATSYAGGTIGENGCGPTCLAMAYVALTGNRDRGPVEMAELSERLGCTVDGMTTWSFMVDGAAAVGLTSEEIPAGAEAVRSALAAGKVVVCSVVPGDFTTTGHFIVLAGLTADGQVEVRDPNSAARTAETWDLAHVLDQCANLWAMSA